ncbi:MAG TPA: hypothetical protein VFZ65_22845 [Planctomycetota bacterium]|nr:hypothetical protein [Planctomycetota bacterium]
METTVTGLFANAEAAQKARSELDRAGFPSANTVLITEATEHRHQLLGEETADATRGAVVGTIVCGVGMAIGAAAMALPPVSLFDAHFALTGLAGGVCGAIAGGAIGFLVGSATGHQVQEHYEHAIENGGVVVAINTDQLHVASARAVLERAGGRELSTAVHGKHHAPQQRTA